MLSFRLPKVTMTPFGSDVDPEVNCRNATSSGLMLGSSKLLRLLMLLLLLLLSLVPLPPRPLRRKEEEEGDAVHVGRISSLTSGQWYGKSGQPLLPVATAFSLDARRSLLTSGQRRIILGSQPYTTSWSLRSDFLRLAGLGGYTGTAMTPALMHPRNTARKRSPKLKASTALSPLLKPSVTRSRCAICVERGRCVGQRGSRYIHTELDIYSYIFQHSVLTITCTLTVYKEDFQAKQVYRTSTRYGRCNVCKTCRLSLSLSCFFLSVYMCDTISGSLASVQIIVHAKCLVRYIREALISGLAEKARGTTTSLSLTSPAAVQSP